MICCGQAWSASSHFFHSQGLCGQTAHGEGWVCPAACCSLRARSPRPGSRPGLPAVRPAVWVDSQPCPSPLRPRPQSLGGQLAPAPSGWDEEQTASSVVTLPPCWEVRSPFTEPRTQERAQPWGRRQTWGSGQDGDFGCVGPICSRPGPSGPREEVEVRSAVCPARMLCGGVLAERRQTQKATARDSAHVMRPQQGSPQMGRRRVVTCSEQDSPQTGSGRVVAGAVEGWGVTATGDRAVFWGNGMFWN